MAKLAKQLPEYVTCKGCVFAEALKDFNGHCFCSNSHVRMIQVTNNPKPCIWKQENAGN